MTIFKSVEDLVAAVEAAEKKLEGGKMKAEQAMAFIEQAEAARVAADERLALGQAEREAGCEAMRKAEALQALLGAEAVAAARVLVEQTWATTEVEVAALIKTAEEAEAGAAALAGEPEVEAYVAFQDAERAAEAGRVAEIRAAYEKDVADLQSEPASSEVIDALEDLAAQVAEAGFGDVASAAESAAASAKRAVAERTELDRIRSKAALKRFANGSAGTAHPGDFVMVLQEAGEQHGQAVLLRPEGTRSGRVSFAVLGSFGLDNTPESYSDLPGRSRVWRWRRPPEGEVDGLSEEQAQMVARIGKRGCKKGWDINKANARLTEGRRRQAARAESVEVALVAEGPAVALAEEVLVEEAGRLNVAELVTVPAVVVETPSVGEDPVAPQPEKMQVTEPVVPDAVELAAPVIEAQPVVAEEVEGLEGLEPRVVGKMERASITTWQQLIEVLAAGDEAFLDLPGIGAKTLESVKVALESRGAGDAESEGQAEIADTPAGAVASQPEPTITVEGDGVEAARLAQWRGVVRVGLGPVAKRLGFEEVQLLVHEDEGLSTLLVYWPGGETTVSCDSNGRAGMIRAVRRLVGQLDGSVQV